MGRSDVIATTTNKAKTFRRDWVSPGEPADGRDESL
jgi:hypothetical protein